MPNGISYPYHSDEFVSVLGFFTYIQILNRTFGKQTMPVSGDPDQMSRFAASGLVLYSLPMSHKKDTRHLSVNVFLRTPRGSLCSLALLK